MKAFLRWFSIFLTLLVLALAVTAGAIYWGWMPVPEWMVHTLASARGLDESQARSLNRLAHVYQVLKTAPESPLLDKAIDLAAKGTNETGWMAFAREAWPQIGDETKDRLRQQLQIEQPDFQALDALVTRVASDGGRLGAADETVLRDLDAKYGVSELVEQLRRGR